MCCFRVGLFKYASLARILGIPSNSRIMKYSIGLITKSFGLCMKALQNKFENIIVIWIYA